MNRRDTLIDRVSAAYRHAYGSDPERLIAAPGRVNLIGEHCDYNHGLVLPCAINRETIVAVGRGSGVVRSLAADLDGGADSFSLSGPIERSDEDWKNHIRGVASLLANRGVELAPANLAIAGDIPMGAGLSSSASLGVGVGLALSLHAGAEISAKDIARIAQRSENDFVGCACGIMDQLASACSQAGSALLIDCRDLTTRAIDIPDSLALIVVDTGIRRTLTASPFNQRRAECEAAARHYGVDALRDLDGKRLVAERGNLANIPFRRARHVVSEIDRVRRFSKALPVADTAAIAELMAQSHASLRDDFEVTLPPIDDLVAIMAETVGEHGGARITGGGFGGCVIALVRREVAESLRDRVRREYRPPDGGQAKFMICEPSAGAAQIG